MTTNTTIENAEIIQYVPFTSFIHPSFWHSLTEMKLDVDRLNDSTRPIFGRFTCKEDLGPVFEVDGTSFNSNPSSEALYQYLSGTIMNKNTIEDFKTLDKSAIINTIGEKIWTNIKNKSWIENPNILLNFFILSFADLKKYSYYYWFAFPAPCHPIVSMKEKTSLNNVLNENQIQDLTEKYKNLENKQKLFFALTLNDETVTVYTISELLNEQNSGSEKFEQNFTKVIFSFSDPNNGENPGWPLRLFIAALLEHYDHLAGCDLQVIGIRSKSNGDIYNSRHFKISVPKSVDSVESAGWVGWERNDRRNFGPKLANMSASMDPVKLADASSDLNIKLMKWRLVPDINLDLMKNTKCLLLGAGTLGCQVARDLLAWGFKNITFVDNGKVSYSNPTRQVLFNHVDCHAGGKLKAEAAAFNMKHILPSAKTNSLVAHIPMPGHPVGDSLLAETLSNIKILTDAIVEHDVVFLLLDTREARWMPTLIAAHYGKIVINAALGFDSYLVMRHGVATGTTVSPARGTKYIPGSQLGCYFCNDVTAPGNSMKDRTLDQQCTVTRPGVAAIAGALAVELLVSLIQHPLKVNAPAAYDLSNEMDKGMDLDAQSVLGPIPHSIRGFLWSYQNVVPTCTKFSQCIACSDSILQKYRDEGTEFLMKVINNAKYLEEVTGLEQLQLAAEMTDILTLSDSEED